jgi:hypothetical protein
VEPLQTGRGRLCTRQHVITQLMNSEAWSIDKLGYYHQHFEISVRSRLNRLKVFARLSVCTRQSIRPWHDPCAARCDSGRRWRRWPRRNISPSWRLSHPVEGYTTLRIFRKHNGDVWQLQSLRASCMPCMQVESSDQHGDNSVAKEFCFTACCDKLSQ